MTIIIKSRQGLFDTVKESIAEVVDLRFRQDELTELTNLDSDLGFDSLDLIELVMTVEEKLNIEIPDEVADGYEKKTIGEFINLIEGIKGNVY